jgi:hypothetical protein
MQVMPFWLDEIGHPDDNVVDMQTKLRMGCPILKYYMDMEKNDLRNSLARYTGSCVDIRHTCSAKLLNALSTRWRQK